MIKNIFNKISLFFVFLYVFLCLLFPAADIIISKKVVFFILMCFFVLKCFSSQKVLICNKAILLKVLILISIVLLFSIPSLNYYFDNTFFLIISILPLLLTLYLYTIKKEFCRIFLFCCNILALITIIIALSSTYSNSLLKQIQKLFLTFNSGFLGERYFGSFKLQMVHFRTAPVLIISISFYYVKWTEEKKLKNFLLLLLNLLAIFFTASRGIYLFSLLSLLFITLGKAKNKKYLINLSILSIVLFIGLYFVITNTNMLSTKEKSNNIKIEHIKSFNNYIKDDPLIVLWGKGTGSEYFTSGFDRNTFQTEVTYIDMIRYWGIFVTLLFLYTMIVPYRKIKVELFVPFLMYFINATTNPLIFCSTGMLIITLYFIIQEDEDDKYLSNSCNL